MRKYLLILPLLLLSCRHQNPTLSSFESQWGVVCYFEYSRSSPSQRNVFLPLENQADSNSITSVSSIFDFKYKTGMGYYDQGQSMVNYKIYWLDDQKNVLAEKDYNYVKIFWAFVKLKFHSIGKVKSSSIVNSYHLTLIDANKQLAIGTLNLGNTVAIDTAFFKKVYTPPVIAPAKSRKIITKPRPGYYL